MEVREAAIADAEGMSDVLAELVATGQRHKPATAAFVLSHYLEHPERLHCFVALDEQGKILGFQSLKRATAKNPYETPVGWGIIGTHVRPSSSRQGVGSSLFTATLAAAREQKLPAIEAYIGEQNLAALDYYRALRFRTYRRPEGVVCKLLELDGST